MSILNVVLVMVLVVVLAWWWLRRRAAGKGAKAADRIDTLIGWPPQPTRVLSTPERLAYGVLVRALPGHMILAQVPLSRFLDVPRRNSYADWLRRVGNQCADFVVCDMAAQVVAVVEIQPPQASERARKRQARIARTLKAAKIPLHVWNEAALPSADAAREAILPKPEPGAPTASETTKPAVAARQDVGTTPVANPFDDTDRDSTQDEMIELLAPPPSTWFDELDTGPAPLTKR